MNRKIVRWIAIVIIAAMVITSLSFVVMAPGLFGNQASVAYGAETPQLENTSQEELAAQMDILEKYIQFLKLKYKDQVDYQLMIEGAFTGATNALGDRYTEYYVTEEGGDDFMESVNGVFTGIGVSIENSENGVRVVSTFLNSPAEKSGMKAGDIIIKIDGADVSLFNSNQVSKKLRGELGTSLVVSVKRGMEEFTFTMTREVIKTNSVSSKVLDGKIGYIKISSFDMDTGAEFDMALTSLRRQGVAGIVLDLRDNGGGLVSSAVSVANQMIKEGIILNFVNQGNLIESTKATGTSVYDLPTVVLVNENSASSTEILAAALKENGAATLVGKTTYGKGIAQIVTEVGNGNQAKVSTYYFTTPNNGQIHEKGVVPHHMVEQILPKGQEVMALYNQLAPMAENTKPGLGQLGLNVYGAQQRLALLGYDVAISGMLDDKTYLAVMKFQKDSGLYSYGVLDYTTRDKIIEAAYQYVYGTGEGDRQLEKALQLLK